MRAAIPTSWDDSLSASLVLIPPAEFTEVLNGTPREGLALTPSVAVVPHRVGHAK